MLKQNSNRHERIDLWAKIIKHFGNFGRHFPALYPQKSTRVHAASIFADVAQGKCRLKFYAFGPQLITFMSVGILLNYFRRKLLQFD